MLCTFFEGLDNECNFWRKMSTHEKIVYNEYIELCTFFENLSTLIVSSKRKKAWWPYLLFSIGKGLDFLQTRFNCHI